MPLTPISDLMDQARCHRYAVGYFESWNLESLQGVIDAAERSQSPIIIGFNGEFLSRPERSPAAQECLAWYGALGKAAADSASIPVGFIFNECPRDTWVRHALENTDENPHHLLGYGGDDDVLVAGRQAVCEAVLDRNDWLGCRGKAELYG